MIMRTVTSAIMLVAAASGGAAQQPTPAEFWMALEESRSAAEVAAVPAPADLHPQVASALRRLREYELRPVRSTAYRARQDLQRRVKLQPRDPWTHLALALVLRRGPDAHARNSAQKAEYHFVDPYSLASMDALRALRRALELDPALEPAALELASYAVERHDDALLHEADAVLRGMEQSGNVLLARAAIALRRDDTSAVLALADAAGHAGGDAARVAHVRAVALLRDPQTEARGTAVYMEGLKRASRAAMAEYHRSAAPVFFRHEAEHWDTLPHDARAQWLLELWELRAAMSGVSLEERLGQHFRRMHEAQTEFPLTAPFADAEMYGGAGILVGEEMRRHGLSVPGLMLVRFGDAGRVRWLGICGTTRMPYMPDMRQRTRNTQMPTAGVLDRMLPPGGRRPVDAIDVLQADDRQRIREVDCRNPSSLLAFTRYIVDGDRYLPRFGGPLPLQTELYAFRGEAGADVYAALTLERRHVAAVAGEDGRLSLTAALALVDTAARSAARTERVLNFALPDERASHVLLLLPAGTTLHGAVDVRVTVSDSARSLGSVVALTHNVPDFSVATPVLSDLVIAPAEAADRLTRGDVSLAVAAGRSYRSGETFNLYYELYNLPQDAQYRTRIVLAPQASPLWRAIRQVTGREQDVVAIQFEERATPHARFGVQQLRSIATSNLRPGTYRLQIEITELASGRTALRERLLSIH
jgi:hypothetical protein